ncbi:MAG: hypothetical protein SNF33_00270 (plasmid) [Candidatus Algichlamydia australiensis]|nr:hypothetical protein [Chlamydiales bacterium]
MLLLVPQGTIYSEEKIHLSKNDQNQDLVLVDHFVTCTMSCYTGLYTLFGVKPVTEFCIEYELISEIEKDKSRKDIEVPSWKIHHKDSDYKPWETSRREQWEAFKKKIDTFSLKEHFFVEYCFNDKYQIYNALLFVHEPSLIELLNHHYPLFEQRLGEKFDTIEKVQELKNGEFRFWDKIFKDKDHYLMGLLFGFGEENSKAFQLESEGDKEVAKRRRSHTPIAEARKSFENTLNLQDLRIPSFVSYSKQGEDKIVESYYKKRKSIQQYLEGKNLTKETLHILEFGHTAEIE